MTDKEIIKALEDLIEIFDGKAVDFMIISVVLNLINRQKSEIERMETNCLTMAQTMPNMAKAERAEAKKEFVEELIYKIVNTPTKFESTYYMYREGIAFRQNEIIDIIKEMVGEN